MLHPSVLTVRLVDGAPLVADPGPPSIHSLCCRQGTVADLPKVSVHADHLVNAVLMPRVGGANAE